MTDSVETQNTPIKVSVTALANFACRTGDLVPDGVIGPTAAQGIRAHRRLQKELLESSSSSHALEVEASLNCECLVDNRTVRLSARIDLLDRTACQIGEIKTTLVPAAQLPESQRDLHWAQLYLYGYLFLQQKPVDARGHVSLELKLLHVNIRAQETHTEIRTPDPCELNRFAQDALARYVRWISKVEKLNAQASLSAQEITFPFNGFRDGQHAMASAVFRASRDAGYLMCEAPTGIGKTISSLFPGIKSLGEGQVKQIIYLTAKVAGRKSAMQALRTLQDSGLYMRAIQIRAKQSSCFCSNGRCDRDERGRCPMTLGFFDRLQAARNELIEQQLIDSDCFDSVAWNHQLCPFELTQQMLPWVHVVVADYNYVFDPLVRLPHFSSQRQSALLLIDEAHNLLDRSRHMYSASLSRTQCIDEADRCREHHPLIAKKLTALSRELLSVAGQDNTDEHVIDAPGTTLVNQVSHLVGLMFEALSQPPVLSSQQSLDLFRTLCRFLAIADLYGASHRCIIKTQRNKRYKDVVISLFCLDASSWLADQYKTYRAIALFSASLRPGVFFRDTLGLPSSTQQLQLESPFDNNNTYQAVVGWIDTRFSSRQQSLSALVDLIKESTSHRAGNYLVFFPSYTYLEHTHQLFAERYGELETWVQDRNHSKTEQSRQLEHLENSGHRIGFAIQGGVFGEGIDYVGDLLIGVIVVGTGLPGFDLQSKLIARHYEDQGRDGFDFAYRFPGFTRVLQTAGRLIRGDTDNGIILLVDSRFTQQSYKELYPAHWKLDRPRNLEEINTKIKYFWKGMN